MNNFSSILTFHHASHGPDGPPLIRRCIGSWSPTGYIVSYTCSFIVMNSTFQWKIVEKKEPK